MALEVFDELSGLRRLGKIENSLTSLYKNPTSVFDLLKIRMEKLTLQCGQLDFLSARAQVLTPPTLIYGGNNSNESRIADGSWSMKGRKFVNPSQMHSFAVVADNSIADAKINKFFQDMEKALGNTNFVCRANLVENYRDVTERLDSCHLQNRQSCYDSKEVRNDVLTNAFNRWSYTYILWMQLHEAFRNAVDKAKAFYSGMNSGRRQRFCYVKHTWDDLSRSHMSEARMCLVRPLVTGDHEAIPIDGKRFLAFNSRDENMSAFVIAKLLKGGKSMDDPPPWLLDIRFDEDGKIWHYLDNQKGREPLELAFDGE